MESMTFMTRSKLPGVSCPERMDPERIYQILALNGFQATLMACHEWSPILSGTCKNHFRTYLYHIYTIFILDRGWIGLIYTILSHENPMDLIHPVVFLIATFLRRINSTRPARPTLAKPKICCDLATCHGGKQNRRSSDDHLVKLVKCHTELAVGDVLYVLQANGNLGDWLLLYWVCHITVEMMVRIASNYLWHEKQGELWWNLCRYGECPGMFRNADWSVSITVSKYLPFRSF